MEDHGVDHLLAEETFHRVETCLDAGSFIGRLKFFFPARDLAESACFFLQQGD